MAEVIPTNYVLVPNRYLIQEESPGSCIGTIIQEPEPSWGPFDASFTLQRSFTNPAEPEEPGEPVYPATLTIKYTKVIFVKEQAQEVKIDDEDYYMVHSDHILAFIPPE